MLKPEYFNNKEDRLLEIYRQLEDFILEDISMRLLKAGEMSGTADRLIYKLKQMGESQHEIEKKLSELTGLSRKELRYLLQDAVLTSWEDDLNTFSEIGIEIASPLENENVIRVMNAEYKKSLGELSNLTRSTMKKSQVDLMNMLDEADFRVASGIQSYSAAICDILDRYAGKGIEVEYPTGTKRSLEAAVRMCVVTSMNQTAAQVTNQYIVEAGSEYVLVSAHLGARIQQKGQPYLAGHDNWQGRAYRIRGSEKGYPNLLESTGYDIDPKTGQGKVVDSLGLHGYNCRHSHQPWDKRLKNPYLDEKRNLKIDNEENRKRYELQQKQRAMERAIRKTKRELLIKQQEINMVAETDVKSILQTDYDKLAYKLREQNRKYNDFCEENDLQKQYDRIKVSGFKRAQSSKANGAATRYANKQVKSKYDKAGSSASQYAKSNDLGKEVYYNKDKNYRIDLPGYSEKINDGLSAAAKEVALEGSETRYEHMRLVNLDTGKIECPYTDELPNQVGGRTLYRYLDSHSENRYAFIHNHNVATELSFPDIELMANNKQISVVAAVRNDGIITLVESNGIHTNEYLMLKYENQIKEFAKKNFGYPVPTENLAEYIEKLEIFIRNLTIKDFSKGGLREYGENT